MFAYIRYMQEPMVEAATTTRKNYGGRIGRSTERLELRCYQTQRNKDKSRITNDITPKKCFILQRI